MKRPPYGQAALAGLTVWLLYVVTLAPTTAFWDTSEYIATAHIVGIPHPPGNPLFVFLGRAWSLLLAPLGLPVAVRINLLAATTSAAATGFLFLVAHRVLTPLFGRRGPASIGAGCAALLGATAFTVWNQSNVNEKVYTVSVLIIAVVSWLAVRWYDRREEPGSGRLLLWCVLLLALGSTNHMMSVLPAPALGIFVLVSAPRVLLRPAILGRAALLAIVGLSFNLVLPIRAALDPVINEGDPTCDGFVDAAAAVYSAALPDVVAERVPSCGPLADNLARVQYQTPPLTERQAPIGAQMRMYWQYFDWQWARGMDPDPIPSPARLPLSLLFLGLGLGGLWLAWRSDPRLGGYLLVLTGTLTLALVVYLNFRHGYSLSPDIADPAMHEVRERDYFFVAGFLLWGCLAGIGLAGLWHMLAGMGSAGRKYVHAAPVLLLAAVPLMLNWSWASRAGDYAARDWAFDLLMSVEPYGVLFTNGDNDTFPLWYLQEVEGVRQDVTVIVGQYLFTTWYPKQLKALTTPARQRPFDGASAPGLYEASTGPSASITSLTEREIDSVSAVRLGEDLTVGFPGLAVRYPAGTTLSRANQIALRIVLDSIDERPIYFSSPSGMITELGLGPWGVRHGLVTKLEVRNLDEPAPEGWIRGSPDYGGAWFDLDHSMRLWDDVYLFRGLRDRPIWQDNASTGIPAQYYVTALQLAGAAERGGLADDVVTRLVDDALAFEAVARGGRAVARLPGPDGD